MPTIVLPLTLEQYRQLPRNPAYRYDFLEGKAYLTPQAKHYHAILDLHRAGVDAEVNLRPVQPGDWSELAPVFSAAFRHIQPFGSLDEDTRRRAAEDALDRVRQGGDGPWIEQASRVAVDEGNPIGAIFITLLPDTDPCDYDSYHWDGPPPPDAIASRRGRPHLTWIFVDPIAAGDGIGTALLAGAVRELRALGFSELLSTFVTGNTSSMLWHWRNGFRLLAHPGSKRLLRQRLRGMESRTDADTP
jgi:GNAT superfamily N-acetyltransferase